MQESIKHDIIELTAAVISLSRLSNVPVKNSSDSIPEPVNGNIGNNVLSIWKIIDSKVAQLQPTSTVTFAIIEVQ